MEQLDKLVDAINCFTYHVWSDRDKKQIAGAIAAFALVVAENPELQADVREIMIEAVENVGKQ